MCRQVCSSAWTANKPMTLDLNLGTSCHIALRVSFARVSQLPVLASLPFHCHPAFQVVRMICKAVQEQMLNWLVSPARKMPVCTPCGCLCLVCMGMYKNMLVDVGVMQRLFIIYPIIEHYMKRCIQ